MTAREDASYSVSFSRLRMIGSKEGAMPFGKITGLAIGVFIAHYFILPQGVIYALQTRAIPSIGLARLVVALIITIGAVSLFHFLDRR